MDNRLRDGGGTQIQSTIEVDLPTDRVLEQNFLNPATNLPVAEDGVVWTRLATRDSEVQSDTFIVMAFVFVRREHTATPARGPRDRRNQGLHIDPGSVQDNYSRRSNRTTGGVASQQPVPMDTGSSSASSNTYQRGSRYAAAAIRPSNSNVSGTSSYRGANARSVTEDNASAVGPNGTIRVRRMNPNASTTTSRSARQRLSEAGEYVEEGGYYDALPHVQDESFESGAGSIISDPGDPDIM